MAIQSFVRICCAIVGAIPILGGFANVLPVTGALAQSVIVPDGTLGGERSVVEVRPTQERITGGASRGINLFHSFREFNVGAGRSTYFIAPNSEVENILARVTGSNRSDIFGKLGTAQIISGVLDVSNANLFLINPNGIVFGRNSSLDVGRSFVATTANAVGFGDTGLFSASNPTSSNLLTIDPSVFIFSSQQPQPIVNLTVMGLQVSQSQSLLLVGGDVRMEGGILRAPGGRIELGGLSVPGNVSLEKTDSELRLKFSEGVARSDVSLIESSLGQSIVNVVSDDGGSITINAQNLSMLGKNSLEAGIASGLGTVNSRAGDITVNATESIKIEGSGGILNTVQVDATGNAGAIILNTSSLIIKNGAQLNSSTFGTGDGGNITLTVRDTATFDGVQGIGFRSGAGSIVNFNAVGKGGTVTVNAGTLNVTNGAFLSSTTFGKGDAGNVTLMVRDRTTFDGVGNNGFPGFAGSRVAPDAVGKGGTLTVNTGSLNVTNGAQLNSSTFGMGDAGNITLTVRDTATFDGVGSNGLSSTAESKAGVSAVGKGGILTVNAGSLNVTNGAVLTSTTSGQGDAGNITLTVRGTATFDGVGSNGFSSTVGSQVALDAVGKGGTLMVNAGALNVTNGAQLNTSTFGTGDAGNIILTVRDNAIFDGVGSNRFSSTAESQAGFKAVGKGGTLMVSTGSLNVINGAQLNSRTLGQGDAGGIFIRVRETLQIKNGLILTSSLLTAGGIIDINAKTVRLLGSGDIVSSVFSGAGGGGDITITARSIVAFNDSDILAFARDGRGGNVKLNTRAFFGQNYRPAPFGADPATLDGNDRVDINASGSLSSGTITTPDTSFIQNSLNQLPTGAIDTTKLLANTCIVRKDKPEGTFYITGTGGLPNRPGDLPPSQYPTNTIQSTQTANRPWQKGDPIVEPSGFYTLTNGRLVMSRECAHEVKHPL
jgi:filamentous hemagglutinin family protein